MHQGRLLQVAAPTELYRSPDNEFVATFLGKGRIIEGKVVSTQAAFVMVEVEGGVFRCRGQAAPGSQVRILIRPEHVAIVASDDSNAVWRNLTIEEATPAGETTDVLLGRGAFKLESVVLGQSRLAIGTTASVRLDPDGPVVIPQQ
jgi:ABC-type Fe3+/spermidine/putrescine transport system ATPase subunit